MMGKLKEEISELIKVRDNFDTKISDLLNDRDILQSQLKEMNTARQRAYDDKEKFLKLSKIKTNYMEKELNETRLSNIKLKEDIQNLEKQIKLSNEEKEQLRDRINEIKLKRNVQAFGKIWRNWNKDFVEKENFKWSWVTHLREWSGKMWWWWGSTDKRNIGCKTDYHISKNYNEIEDGKLMESDEMLLK